MTSKEKTKTLWVLTGLAAAIAVSRLHFYDEPQQWDISAFAVMGRELLNGFSMYSDLWDHKPPGTHVTYAFARFIVRDGPASVYVLGVAAAVATLLGVYLAGSAGNRGANAGLWAAGFWAVVSGDAFIQANQPNSEVFINVFLIWSFVLLVRDDGQGTGNRRAVAVGALWVLATLYKPNMIFYPMVFACAHILFPPGENPDRKRAIRQVLVMAGVGFLVWAAVISYFGVTGRFGRFMDFMVVLNSFYSKGLLQNIITGLTFDKLFPAPMFFLLPLIFLAGISFVFGPLKKPGRHSALLAAYALPAPLTIASTGRFFPYYYQVWLPWICVACAWGLKSAYDHRKEISAFVVNATASAAIIFIAVIQIPYYQISLDGVTEMKYDLHFMDSKRMGEKIDKILLPGETFFLWGMESQIYFYSDRPAPQGLFSSLLYSLGPLAPKLSEEVRTKISGSLPELFIMTPYSQRDHSLLKYFRSKYALFPKPKKYFPFELYYLRGGKLESRLLTK